MCVIPSEEALADQGVALWVWSKGSDKGWTPQRIQRLQAYVQDRRHGRTRFVKYWADIFPELPA